VRVCVVGSGGREHALASVLGRSAQVVVTPGNAGIPGSVEAAPEDLDGVDLYVIGPEVPLVDGLADRLRSRGARVFGPGADGARLEGSKAWMKEVLVSAGVPTAAHASFGAGELDVALTYLRRLPPPYVVKTDGLAAGKGVLVTESFADAEDDVRSKLDGSAFGAAGRRVVIEQGLSGPEVSLMCVCDGRVAVPLASARDYKRVGDGDAGPNTGGMGAFSPVAAVGTDEAERLVETMVAPTLHELHRRGIDYRGVLYAGLMLTPAGPKVLEFNVRFGDPEAQVVLPRWTGDVAGLLAAAADGSLQEQPSFSTQAAVTVVCATEGYPRVPRTGDLITGLDGVSAADGVQIFTAGVAADERGRLVTGGGRVLSVTALGADIADARARAYDAVAGISWPGMHARSDIAAV
jgi:phosphoribosylamine--glycine ligase